MFTDGFVSAVRADDLGEAGPSSKRSARDLACVAAGGAEDVGILEIPIIWTGMVGSCGVPAGSGVR